VVLSSVHHRRLLLHEHNSTYLLTGCVLSEKNSRSSPRSLAQSPQSSPGRLLTKACPCCVDSNTAVRKRLASHFDDDSETAVQDHKRMRHSLNAGARLTGSSRSYISPAMEPHDSARQAHKTVVTTVGQNVASGVVKRGRGRPRKVSSLYSIMSCRISGFITALAK